MLKFMIQSQRETMSKVNIQEVNSTTRIIIPRQTKMSSIKRVEIRREEVIDLKEEASEEAEVAEEAILEEKIKLMSIKNIRNSTPITKTSRNTRKLRTIRNTKNQEVKGEERKTLKIMISMKRKRKKYQQSQLRKL
jgi:hypothetical protein